MESSISKLVMKLVRRLDQKIEKLMVQFIGSRWVRSCDTCFKNEEDTLFLILIGLIISGKEAIKLAPFKGTLEGTSRLSWWVMSLFHSDGRNSCFIEDAR